MAPKPKQITIWPFLLTSAVSIWSFSIYFCVHVCIAISILYKNVYWCTEVAQNIFWLEQMWNARSIIMYIYFDLNNIWSCFLIHSIRKHFTEFWMIKITKMNTFIYSKSHSNILFSSKINTFQLQKSTFKWNYYLPPSLRITLKNITLKGLHIFLTEV